MISSETARSNYIGTGDGLGAGVRVYSYTFRITNEDNLLVTVRHPTTHVETTLTKTTDYTVDGVGESGGGEITLVDNDQAWLTDEGEDDGFLIEDWALTISLKEPRKQTTNIRNQKDFHASSHENAFDARVRTIQTVNDAVERSVKLPVTIHPDANSPSDFDPTLPGDVIDSANRVIIINEDSDGFEIGPSASQIEDAEGHADDAEASATAAATSETNAATSETNADTSATNAANSATAAATSATEAADSATTAAAAATQALKDFFGEGITTEGGFVIADGQSTYADIDGLLHNNVYSVMVWEYVIYRRDNAGDTRKETGIIKTIYKQAGSTYEMTRHSDGDDDALGVADSIALSGAQAQYKSDTMGGSYFGQMTFRCIRSFDIEV